MADLTRYLDAGLATGLNDGTSAANAYQSWDDCITDINIDWSDLVTATNSAEIIVLNTSGGQEDVGATDITPLSVISNSTYFLEFKHDTGTEAPGIWNTGQSGFKGRPTGNNYTLAFSGTSTAYYIFTNLQFEYDPGGATGSALTSLFANSAGKTAGSEVIFNGCYFKGTAAGAGTGTKSIFYSDSGNLTITMNNCVEQDLTTTGTGTYLMRHLRSASEGVNTFANCTFDNCDELFNNSNGSNNTRTVNCLYNDVADADINGGGATGTGYNAANDTVTLPGSNNANSRSFSFVSYPDNLHLSADTDNDGAGTGTATYGQWVPANDIDGDARPTGSGDLADAGMDEYVAGGSITPHSSYTPNTQLSVKSRHV